MLASTTRSSNDERAVRDDVPIEWIDEGAGAQCDPGW
jgi:hypothetical protein